MQNNLQASRVWLRPIVCWLYILAAGSLFLTPVFVKASVPEPQSWSLLANKHGIQTFSGELPGSRFMATKHIVELEAAAEQVLAALGDGSAC
ncbi:MAG: hypothetical protein KJO24_05230, partial [Gammaproteobacteria bacterium]|nr:hypothetical protein [Gammaproteobacteria bacterium]